MSMKGQKKVTISNQRSEEDQKGYGMREDSLGSKRKDGCGDMIRGYDIDIGRPRTFSTPIGDSVRRRRSVRSQRYYGSVELLVSVDTSGRIKNVGRFRLEPGPDQGSQMPSISAPSSPVVLENPQAETKWYFRFFLGKEHQIFAGIEPASKLPFFLSILMEEEQAEKGAKCRAILWGATGPKQRCFTTTVLPKPITAKAVLQKFPSLSDYPRSLKEIVSPKIQKDLMILEEQEGSLNLKFGIIFGKTGQMSDEEMLSNETGDQYFDQFLSIMGQKVELKGWGSFRGGLDTASNTTGINSLYTTYLGHEIMYHVSTMLPYTSDQQIERKRHIGNDIVNIIFESSPDPDSPTFNPSMMKSQFTHIFALVTYDPKKLCYRLWVFSEESVPAYGPALPCPAEFYDAQIFRDFLLTKLLNGEKAAFCASAFVDKRLRTNENLLRDMYMEYMKECPKSFHMSSEPLIKSKSSSPQNILFADNNAFIKYGELLKLETMLSGEAPEYYISSDKKNLHKKYPWEPLLVAQGLSVSNVITADSWGQKEMLIGCEFEGVLAMKDKHLVCVIEPYAKVEQISILENFGIMLLRCTGKESYVCALPLSELKYRVKSGTPFYKSDCFASKIASTKGCHLYALTNAQSLRLSVAVAIGKRVLLFRWTEGLVTKVGNLSEIATKFTLLNEVVVSEDPIALSVYESSAFGSVRACTVNKHCAEMVDFNIWTVKTVFNLNVSKPTVTSVLVSDDADNNEELLITYDNTTIIIDISELDEDILKPSLEVYWTSNPTAIVYHFPFLIAFTDDVIEVRLGINGNLLSTIFMPSLHFLTSKVDILFLGESSESLDEPIDPGITKLSNLYRIPFNSLTSNGIAPSVHNTRGTNTMSNVHSPVLGHTHNDTQSSDISKPKLVSPLHYEVMKTESGGGSFDSDSGIFVMRQKEGSQTDTNYTNSLPQSPFATATHLDVFDNAAGNKPPLNFQ